MSPQHIDLAQGRWHTMTLADQLGNIGSDYERAWRWKTKQQAQLFINAARRTLELLDLTLTDPRWRGLRRRELARVREEVCQELFENKSSAPTLQKYFLSMATLARRGKR